MTYLEDAKSLELIFSDGTTKIISLEGMGPIQKTFWRDSAKALYEANTFITGWAIS